MKKVVFALAFFLIVYCTLYINNCSAQWVQTNGPYGGEVTSFCYTNYGTYLFAGTYYGGVFRSSNNGSTWEAVNNGLANYIINGLAILANTTPNYLYAATDGGVFRSTDFGENWVSANNGITEMSIASIFVYGMYTFVGTGNSGVFRSIDNGNNWVAVNNGITNYYIC
jgi:photosystem II stability/assembly factor-like uncharacterized protein